MTDEARDDAGARQEAERRRLDDPGRVHGEVVDARGLRCPAPIILLARVARDAAEGEVEVWWTDPAAQTDIAAWARMRGHEVLGTEPLVETDDDGANARGAASGQASTAASSSSSGAAAPERAYATRVRLSGEPSRRR